MNELRISRLVCLVMALFPALWGIFSFMNNIADFAGTARNAVEPMLSMKDTWNVPGQAWRAINLPVAPYIGLAVITTMETLAGVLASVGLILMLKSFTRSYQHFSTGKAWAMAGATCAILVWGVGFMVVAGDWFMAWQAKENPLSTQLGALLYMVPNTLALLVFLSHKE
jgi:predicted small integral membrane protein